MSGGVDSSVAAAVLLEQGHQVVGVFLRHGTASPVTCADRGLPVLPKDPVSPQQGCCTASDAEDARYVAHRLNIPFFALDLQDEFQAIMDYFVAEYASGRTPNPCVKCNQWIKFGKLFDYADSLGAEYVATGHYARLTAEPAGGIALRRGVDSDKDQAYVLFGVSADQLSRMMLPLGGYRKTEIRQRAEQLGLRVANKKDSQEICFVPPRRHQEFVAARRPRDTSGDLVMTTGEAVGHHDGIERFTIGQRKGLGVALGEPCFVVRIEPDTNRVVLGSREALARDRLTAGDVNWLVARSSGHRRCLAQVRYNSAAVPATMTLLPDGRLQIEFDQPYLGIAPGQAVVCFDEDRVLCGGWIE